MTENVRKWWLLGIITVAVVNKLEFAEHKS